MRGTKYWIFHMAAGLVLFVLLGVHMVTMHLGKLTGLFVAHSDLGPTALINSHARDARSGFTAAYVLLVGVALYHGFYGLRTLLMELSPRPATARAITLGLVLVGIILFGLASWANLVAHARAIAGGHS